MPPASTSTWKDTWLQLVALDEPHKLKRRLEWDDFAEDDFEVWLASDRSDSALEASSGKAALQEACEALRSSWDVPLLPYDRNANRPFVDLWWPVCCHFAEKLRGEPAVVSSRPALAELVFDQLADALLSRLCFIGEQVLWEVFSAVRTPGAMFLAHLGASGDVSEPPVREHYEQFIKVHRRNGLKSLLEEFPVLGHHIGTVIMLCYRNSVEMLDRICTDRAVLEERFAIPAAFRLVGVKQGLSDPHRGGHAVAVLQFAESDASNCPLQLVYKPKDMRVDAAYQALLEDLNSHGGLEPLRTIGVHVADGYGYMEYVPHRLCADDQELGPFYDNAGRLMAVLHLLGCTDCHHENLIACGDQLLLIDTETLLDVDLPDQISEAALDLSAQSTMSALQKRFRSSVLHSGLLPQWMFHGVTKQPIDISALGVAPPLSAERTVAGWLGLNSDGMMHGRVQREVDIPTSLPVGVGAANPFNRFLDVFCAGFNSQMHELLALRVRWLAHGSVLSAFAGLPRRIVLRSTHVYFAIQSKQLEPSALRSPLAQALQLEQLSRSFLLAETRPLNWPVFAAEVRQMQQLDIPFFTHSIDGDGLQLDYAGAELPGFIHTSGLDAARERLSNLDDDEITFQLRLIRGATEARQLQTTAEGSPAAGVEIAGASKNLQQENAVFRSKGAAERIAGQLLNLAIRDPQGQVEWLGMDLGADGESFAFGPVGLSLYGGSIGIACLLQRLQRLQISLDGAEEVQVAILQPLQDLVAETSADGLRRWWRDQPLGINGCGGILLGLQQLDQQDLVDSFLAAALPRFLQADQQLDVIGGCAGLIGPLLHRGTEVALQLAVRAGDQLLAQEREQGGWVSRLSGRKVLLGFSHGTAGFAAALARLYAATGEERFRIGAANALDYERVRFSKAHGNWPDYRKSNSAHDKSGFMVSWCHGAPGIALSRACLWGTALWDEQCVDEISVALCTMAEKDWFRFDHLCCGTLGLMLIQQALCSGPWPIAAELRARSEQAAAAIQRSTLERCSTEPISLRCLITHEGTLMLPGFFTGLSGMGMALLDDPKSRGITLQLLSAGLWPR